MKLLGVVSTYFPNLEELERNINSYLPWIDYLIIWENTPKEKSSIEAFVKKLNNTKIEFRTTGKNEFLAYPFNQSIKWAEQNDFTHVLTMDQDSCFLEGEFEFFLQLIIQNQQNDIAIFSSSKSADSQLSGKMVEVENAITSGTVYAISIFQKIGYFSEDFLIYMIDIEFGMRVKQNNFRIVCFPEIVLQHQAGYAKKTSSGLLINHYSAQSTYYIIRNTLLTWKLYPHKFSLAEKMHFIRYKVIYRTLKLIFETNKLQKLKAIYIGVFHGFIRKTGRYDL